MFFSFFISDDWRFKQATHLILRILVKTNGAEENIVADSSLLKQLGQRKYTPELFFYVGTKKTLTSLIS